MIHLRRRTIQFSRRCYSKMSSNPMEVKKSGEHPTAGIIVIGDEILKGQVRDSNCFYACKLLYKHGVKVRKISAVQDHLEDIAKEIKRFSNRFDYIFTSGGIGPTHDDVTYQAVALAFNDAMHYHPTLVDVIKNCFDCGTFPSPAYKMAYVPTKSILQFGTNQVTGQLLAYPCVVVRNVYILPGSPVFFETSFQAMCKELFLGYENFATTEVYVNAKEESFAAILSAVARECPNVSFGSYPETNRYYKVRVTMESESKEDTEMARSMFCDRIPSNTLVHYDRTPHIDCLAKYEALIEKCKRRSLYDHTFEIFVNHYKKPDEMWIYLDGSKESVLMIHYARLVHYKLRQNSTGKIHAICLKSDYLNSDIRQFFHDLCERYNVELCSLDSDETDAIRVMKKLVATRSELRTLLLGKRLNGNHKKTYDNVVQLANDPSLSVQVDFPLIDWSDEDVADFFRSFCLPDCTIETKR